MYNVVYFTACHRFCESRITLRFWTEASALWRIGSTLCRDGSASITQSPRLVVHDEPGVIVNLVIHGAALTLFYGQEITLHYWA